MINGKTKVQNEKRKWKKAYLENTLTERTLASNYGISKAKEDGRHSENTKKKHKQRGSEKLKHSNPLYKNYQWLGLFLNQRLRLTHSKFQ